VRILKPEPIKAMTSVQNPGVKNARGVEDRRGLLWDLYVPDAAERDAEQATAGGRRRDRSAAEREHAGDAAANGQEQALAPDFAFGHTGYTGTAIRIWPERGVYAIVLTNRVHPDDSGKVGQLRRRAWEAVEALLVE